MAQAACECVRRRTLLDTNLFVSGTTIFKSKGRVSLDEQMFGLGFDPVRATDGGRYTCLINNRPKPEAVIKMSVLGKSKRPPKGLVMTRE